MKTFKEYYTERKYWGTEAAGTVHIANDTKRILFLKRSVEEDSEQGQWEITIGGKKDDSDHAINITRDRETEEEIGPVEYTDTKSIEVFFDTGEDHRPFKYYVYARMVPKEFVPKLSEEHSEYKWVDINNENDIPKPLHFGAERLIYKTDRIRKLVE